MHTSIELCAPNSAGHSAEDHPPAFERSPRNSIKEWVKSGYRFGAITASATSELWLCCKAISRSTQLKVPGVKMAFKNPISHLVMADLGMNAYQKLLIEPMLEAAANPRVNSGVLQLCAFSLFAAALFVGESLRVQVALFSCGYGFALGVACAAAGLLVGCAVEILTFASGERR